MNHNQIEVVENKKYISSITRSYIFFKFPDGIKKRKKIGTNDILTLKMLQEWLRSEIKFYSRMYRELMTAYETRRDRLNQTQHLYSQDEINEACKKDRFADVDMQLSNRRYLEESYRIRGILEEVNVVLDKYCQMQKLYDQIEGNFAGLQ